NAPPGLDRIGRVFPKVTPVGPETVKLADEWRTSLKQQFELEQRKEELDKRKAALDRTRDRLESEWKNLQDEIKPFDPTNPRVVRLRQRLKDYTTDAESYKATLSEYTADVKKLAGAVAKLRDGTGRGAPNGPFRLYVGQYSNAAD